jgi:hypothetical protein
MKRQNGVALIVVMVALLVMLITVLSLLRNTNASLNIVGSIGFKQNTSSVTDVGVEKARAWLMTKTDAQLSATDPDNGYFETWVAGFDPLTYDWTAAGNSVLVTDDEGTGNSVRYVIHRMCSVTGLVAVVGSKCVPVPSAVGISSQNQASGGFGVGGSTNTAYRITVRVAGPRNSLSFSQVMVH